MSTDQTPDSPRRPRSPLAVASVAAAVLLAGGGGAYWASTASGGGGDGKNAAARRDGDPPPLALDNQPGDGRTGSGPPGIAPGEPDPSGARYRATGSLPDAPDSAAVYRPAGKITKAQVERLAKALDVQGEPRLSQGAWKVGVAKDPGGTQLRVDEKAPGTWTFSRYRTLGGTNCAEPSPPMPEERDDTASSGIGRCPEPTKPGGDHGAEPVSEKAAKSAAAPVLKALGLDDAKLDARQLLGAVRVVNADPVIGGLPTYGWMTGLQIGSDGQLVGGSGPLAAPEKGAGYPVISAQAALKALNKGGGRVGSEASDCASAVPFKGDKGGKTDQVAPCEPRPTPKSDPLPVTKAVFGLAVHFVDGQQALVPSWIFEVKPKAAADSFTVTQPAVDPKYIVETAQPSQKPSGTPSDEPTTGPTGKPGGEETARHIESYSADGRKLTLHYWGGVCDDYSASAAESADKVTAEVLGHPRKAGQICIKMAKDFKKTVTLKEPLGDRKLVDASSGDRVPKMK